MTLTYIFSICLLCAAALIVLRIVMLHHDRQTAEREKRHNAEAVRLIEHNHRLQQELEQAQSVTSLIRTYMAEGILLLDDSDKILLINDSAQEVLALHRADRRTNSIFTLTDNEAFLTALRKSKMPGHTAVRQMLTIDSRAVEARITRTVVGAWAGTIILFVDMTEAFRAEQVRREFTANVSHELKTPLTTISGFGELFASGYVTAPEDVCRYGARIRRESQRLLFLINDILRLSEIEETHSRGGQTVDLGAVARDTQALLQAAHAAADITITVEGEGVLPDANESYIRELFMNLMDNAVKYNEPGGHVWVRIEQEKENIRITVADDGIGIPEEAQGRIFERFYRVDKSRSKERGGTGLGLSIVKHIVETHGGTIALESRLHHGTAITVTLARSDGQEEQGEERV